LGLEIAERFGFSLYDSIIGSAALQSDYTVLFSEDMRYGQKIEAKMVITNPLTITMLNSRLSTDSNLARIGSDNSDPE
jgi:predicted nucleic acid-binding protein